MPYGEHKHRILLKRIAVQRNIARLAARNNELSEPLLCEAPDQGMILQDVDRFGDEIDRFQRSGGLSLQEEIRDPPEISKRSLRVDYARQVFALGLGADLP